MTVTTLDSPAAKAAARVSFQLTYTRASRIREFRPGELTGPDIPDAYGGDFNASGDWNDPRDDELTIDGGWEDGGPAEDVFQQRTEDEWIDRYANYAINEAVHEALEWYKVDGRQWLNPHGFAEAEIYDLVNELVDRLAALRHKHTTAG